MSTAPESVTGSVPGAQDIVRQELHNGMVLLVRENFSSPAVVVQGYLRTGALAEPTEKAGLAAFAAALLNRGTESRTSQQISETIEGLGASLDVSAGRHTTGFSTKSLVEDISTVLEVLADVLQRPTFPEEEIERVRMQWQADLQQRDHDTRRMAAMRFREMLYGGKGNRHGHPYGRSTIGYSDTIAAIRRQDTLDFHYQHYGPSGAVIVVVGAITADVAAELVQRYFLPWNGPKGDGTLAQEPPEVHLEGSQRQDVSMEGKTQSDIVMGWQGVARNDPDYYAAVLANTVLGRFGMYGRLGRNVREKQGLAYYCLSSLDAGIWAGPWYVFAGVNPANVDRALDSIREEVDRLLIEPVSEAELGDSKAYLTGSLPLRLETNEGVANTIVQMERYQLGLDYLHRYAGLIKTVAPADVQRVATRFLDAERYVLAVAGPPPDAAAAVASG